MRSNRRSRPAGATTRACLAVALALMVMFTASCRPRANAADTGANPGGGNTGKPGGGWLQRLGQVGKAAPQAPAVPQWGGTLSRNMVSSETNLPSSFSVGVPGKGNSWETPPQNVRWAARLGSQTYGTPTISGGKVLIGTNNGKPRGGKLTGDRLVLMCFNEADGKFLWHFASPSPDYHGQFSICTGLGICASAAMDDKRAYVITSRCHLVALDLEPLGTRKPTYAKQAEYLADREMWFSKGASYPKVTIKPHAPVQLVPTDANMTWVYDMMTRGPSWPHDANGSCTLLVGDVIYATTGNAKAANQRDTPYPKGPSIVAVDRRTGQPLAKDDAGIAARTWHGQWSSPSYGEVNGKGLVFYGGGDGYVYAFDATAQLTPEGKSGVLKTVWKCDVNPAGLRSAKYWKNPNGPNEVVGTPVFDNNRIYIAAGQDPYHGPGKGGFLCLDATKTGDITKTGVLWRYKGIGRSVSTASVADGLVYIADLGGGLYCLDANTGQLVWKQSLGGRVWGSTLVADGKVYIGTSSGVLWIMKAGRQKQLLSRVNMRASVFTTPVACNGVLYVASHRYLYAISKQGPPRVPAIN